MPGNEEFTRGLPVAFKLVLAECSRAMACWPDWPIDQIHAWAVVQEEIGEALQAVAVDDREQTNIEAVQAAAMCLRFLYHGRDRTCCESDVMTLAEMVTVEESLAAGWLPVCMIAADVQKHVLHAAYEPDKHDGMRMYCDAVAVAAYALAFVAYNVCGGEHA